MASASEEIDAIIRTAEAWKGQKLAELREWNEASPLNRLVDGAPALGIITSGISFMHVREAAPEARVLKLGFTHPLPLKRIAQFARGVERCLVVEEGDPFLVEAIRAGDGERAAHTMFCHVKGFYDKVHAVLSDLPDD